MEIGKKLNIRYGRETSPCEAGGHGGLRSTFLPKEGFTIFKLHDHFIALELAMGDSDA